MKPSHTQPLSPLSITQRGRLFSAKITFPFNTKHSKDVCPRKGNSLCLVLPSSTVSHPPARCDATLTAGAVPGTGGSPVLALSSPLGTSLWFPAGLSPSLRVQCSLLTRFLAPQQLQQHLQVTEAAKWVQQLPAAPQFAAGHRGKAEPAWPGSPFKGRVLQRPPWLLTFLLRFQGFLWEF